jgi:hypothetical protein
LGASLQGSKGFLGKNSDRKRVNVDLISNGRSLAKLKLISLFADMGTDRAQAGLHVTFYELPKFMRFVARQGNAR